MKIKILFMIIIIALALMLAGCGEEVTVNTKDPYVGGDNGLIIQFQEGNPPDMIFDGDTMDFVIAFLMENKGEHDIFEEDNDYDFGRLTLRGVNPEHYGLTQDELTIDFDDYNGDIISIPGYRKNPSDGSEIQGGRASAQFNTMKYQYDLQGNNEVTFGVDLCYNYRTKSTTNICIVSDIMDQEHKICDPQGEKSPKNSGGPVRVSSVKQAFAGQNKLSLMIEISQANADGTIFKTIESANADDKVCDDSATNINKNKVHVEVRLADGSEDESITCSEFGQSNEGTITLYNGLPKMFVCNMDTADVNQDYETPIFIDLEYAYGQYIETNVEIKDYQ